jgi:hypothetical protein
MPDTIENTTTIVEQTIPENGPTFNADAVIEIALRRQNKTVDVPFPSDDQLIARQRSLCTITRRLGRGKSETKTEGIEEADYALLSKLSEGHGLDEAQASIVIGKLLRADPDDATREGDGYAIPITVVGGVRTVHHLKEPTEAQLRKHNDRTYGFIDLRHSKQEMKISVATIGEFYDKLAAGRQLAEGYADGSRIPICHKVAAISELTALMSAEEEDEDPGNF